MVTHWSSAGPPPGFAAWQAANAPDLLLPTRVERRLRRRAARRARIGAVLDARHVLGEARARGHLERLPAHVQPVGEGGLSFGSARVGACGRLPRAAGAGARVEPAAAIA
jgi:hypothetical protein